MGLWPQKILTKYFRINKYEKNLLKKNVFVCTLGSGVIGIPMTIFLYVIVIFIAVVILYLYFLKLHNNGRMMDVYHRLHGENEAFFLPYDLELSNQELAYIVKKAEQWRGEDGERRKVNNKNYISKP